MLASNYINRIFFVALILFSCNENTNDLKQSRKGEYELTYSIGSPKTGVFTEYYFNGRELAIVERDRNKSDPVSFEGAKIFDVQDRIKNVRVQLQDGASESELQELESLITDISLAIPYEHGIRLCKDYIGVMTSRRLLQRCASVLGVLGLECESRPFRTKSGTDQDLAMVKFIEEANQCEK